MGASRPLLITIIGALYALLGIVLLALGALAFAGGAASGETALGAAGGGAIAVFGLIYRYCLTDYVQAYEAVGALIMVGTIVGILMANFLNNGGGAWDNAKKYIEEGNHGGKGSPAHAAAVVGDTVGDPFKDTAGPSIHVLVKLLSTICLVTAVLFIA